MIVAVDIMKNQEFYDLIIKLTESVINQKKGQIFINLKVINTINGKTI